MVISGCLESRTRSGTLRKPDAWAPQFSLPHPEGRGSRQAVNNWLTRKTLVTGSVLVWRVFFTQVAWDFGLPAVDEAWSVGAITVVSEGFKKRLLILLLIVRQASRKVPWKTAGNRRVPHVTLQSLAGQNFDRSHAARALRLK
jgi:hypothetical protein